MATMNNPFRSLRIVCHILAPVFCIATLIALALRAIEKSQLATNMQITNNSIWCTAIIAVFCMTISIGWWLHLSHNRKAILHKGDFVKIVKGPFAGLEGYVIDNAGNKNITVVIDRKTSNNYSIRTSINTLQRKLRIIR